MANPNPQSPVWDVIATKTFCVTQGKDLADYLGTTQFTAPQAERTPQAGSPLIWPDLPSPDSTERVSRIGPEPKNGCPFSGHGFLGSLQQPRGTLNKHTETGFGLVAFL